MICGGPFYSAVSILIACQFLCFSIAAQGPKRFAARFQNGNAVEGNTLTDWHAADSVPKLDNQPLFDPGNPLRWLIDRSMPPPSAAPDSWIEMITGDRLPGRVIGFATGDESPYQRLPPHFLVEYDGVRPATLEPQKVLIRVCARWVRRIVWEKNIPLSQTPKTATNRDGSEISFRSVRFGADGISLLLEKGIQRHPYADLAAIDLGVGDFWSRYLEELAILSPDAQRRLLQLETNRGLVITSSLERIVPRVAGDAGDSNRWVHGVQPAWSLDPIWIPQREVWARRSFASHEMVLTRVPVRRFEQRSPLGDVQFPLGLNRNVEGGLIRTATREAGWGLGIHAMAEIEYELPPLARTIRTEFAIDGSMSSGGCVAARIINASAGNAILFQSPILVGSSNVIDSGVLSVGGPADANRRVVLHADTVLTNRPAGADPFDIRDHANWIEPIVELDASMLRPRIEALSPSLLLETLSGWQLAWDPGSQPKFSQFYAEAPFHEGSFQPTVAVVNGGMKLSLNRPLTDADRWLVVDAVRAQPPGPPAKLSVTIGAGPPKEFDLPIYDKNHSDFRPIVLPLKEARTQKLPANLFELRQLPTSDIVPVIWRCAAMTRQHPLLYQLIEDSIPFVPASKTTNPTLRPDKSMKFFGEAALQVPIGELALVPFERTIQIRERPALGQYRFIRFAVRNRGGGNMRFSLIRKGGAEPCKYETGPGEPASMTTRQLSKEPLKDEWMVVTRDLYSDFGAVSFEAIQLEMRGGQAAWIDHVYFARTQNDFELAKSVLEND